MKDFIKLVSLIICFLVSLSVYGQHQKVSLNGTWDFKIDPYDNGLSENWQAANYPTLDWDEMKVPGNWDIENEYADYFGTAWYRKDFETPAAWQGKAIRLYFQAVYNDVEIWLNGEKIGEHHVGFLPFQFDIGDRIKIGTKNTIALRVNNVFKRGAIWNWGGIRRPVWLEITAPARANYQHITAIPDLKNGMASVGGAFEFQNLGDANAAIEYEWTISKEDKEVYKSSKKRTNVAAGQTIKETLNTKLDKSQVELWHFNHPHLYHSELVVYQNGKEIQRLKDRFGIRIVEVDGMELKLNGEAFRPVGFNIVAEDRVTGNTLPLWRIKEDVDMLKELGANMGRINHLPLPKEFLDYMDEAGIMTFEEVSLWGKDRMVDPEHPLPKYWLEKMVKTKFNHPSVIGWSVGNEIGRLWANPKVMEYVEGAIKHAKELDPTRLAVYVTHSADVQKVDPVKFSDLIMLNKYRNWGENAANTHANHPDKPIFYSEFGKALTSEDPNESIVDLKAVMDQIQHKDYIIGASYWTFNDYRSFYSNGPDKTTPPSQNRCWGIVTTLREKKRAYHVFRRYHAPFKTIKVQPSGKSLDIALTTRSVNEFPTHKLADYSLAWTFHDKHGNITNGDVVDLPTLSPGGERWEEKLPYKNEANATSLKVTILDPQAYSVMDTVIYFAAPPTPSIKSTHSSSNNIRLIYDKVPNAQYYKAKYGEGNLSMETPPTINAFVEIEGLEYDKDYQVQLVAVNEKGESTPTSTQTIRTDEDELPPVIWTTTPDDQAFFVGFTVFEKDYLYDVEYGTEPGNYTKRITLSNVGVLKVPELQNGVTYYYRFRRRMQWGFASEWSHEIKVTPDYGIKPMVPKVYGAIKKDNSVLLHIEPVKKSIGYEVKVVNKASGAEAIHHVKTAQSPYIMLNDLGGTANSEMHIRSMNAFGVSDWVKVH